MIVGNGGVVLSQICQKSRKTIGWDASSIAVEGMSYEDAHCFYDWGEFCLHIIVAAFDAGSGAGAPSDSGTGHSRVGTQRWLGLDALERGACCGLLGLTHSAER